MTSPPYIASSPVLRRFREKCAVVPIGITPPHYLPDEAVMEKVREIRREHGDRIVLFIGRLALYKGIDYLLKAMEEVEGKLIVVGQGEQFSSLAMMTTSLALGPPWLFASSRRRMWP